jgi:two-component system, NarL family, nitrate/nitrite response regulator NarL
MGPSARDKVRVLLVGWIRLYRESLAALLDQDGRLQVSAAVAFSADVAELTVAADVVLIDVPHEYDREAFRQLTSATDKPVVALGIRADERQVIALAEDGVLGFVGQEDELDRLVDGVRTAAVGEASFPPYIATALLRRAVSTTAVITAPEAAALTMREREIATLIAEGLTNKEIASRLHIEVATVKNHVHSVLEKLQVNRRNEAVARLGLPDLDRGRIPALSSR